MNPALLQMPFVQIALPLLAGMFLAVWSNNKAFEMVNKRFDDMNRRFDNSDRRFDDVIKRLDRIETKLDNHEGRIVKLEVETALVKR
jgi:tetrahydromethanopterin S-methyltransferase subunit G